MAITCQTHSEFIEKGLREIDEGVFLQNKLFLEEVEYGLGAIMLMMRY